MLQVHYVLAPKQIKSSHLAVGQDHRTETDMDVFHDLPGDFHTCPHHPDVPGNPRTLTDSARPWHRDFRFGPARVVRFGCSA